MGLKNFGKNLWSGAKKLDPTGTLQTTENVAKEIGQGDVGGAIGAASHLDPTGVTPQLGTKAKNVGQNVGQGNWLGALGEAAKPIDFGRSDNMLLNNPMTKPINDLYNLPFDTMKNLQQGDYEDLAKDWTLGQESYLNPARLGWDVITGDFDPTNPKGGYDPGDWLPFPVDDLFGRKPPIMPWPGAPESQTPEEEATAPSGEGWEPGALDWRNGSTVDPMNPESWRNQFLEEPAQTEPVVDPTIPTPEQGEAGTPDEYVHDDWGRDLAIQDEGYLTEGAQNVVDRMTREYDTNEFADVQNRRQQLMLRLTRMNIS